MSRVPAVFQGDSKAIPTVISQTPTSITNPRNNANEVRVGGPNRTFFWPLALSEPPAATRPSEFCPFDVMTRSCAVALSEPPATTRPSEFCSFDVITRPCAVALLQAFQTVQS